MIIIGVDFHPEFQQIASVDTTTGEFEERRLQHREEAESFYRELTARGMQVRMGMEASGHATLVRTVTGRATDGVVDRRCSRDSGEASAETEDRSTRCTAHFEVNAEG